MPENNDNALVALIVEDADVWREIYKRALEREGYSVVEASNGVEALEYFADPIEYFNNDKPHLILTDTNMPAMGGEAFLRELGAKGYQGIPTLVMSADPKQPAFFEALEVAQQLYSPDQKASLQKILKMDFDRVVGLAKPFDLKDLRERVTAIKSIYTRVVD